MVDSAQGYKASFLPAVSAPARQLRDSVPMKRLRRSRQICRAVVLLLIRDAGKNPRSQGKGVDPLGATRAEVESVKVRLYDRLVSARAQPGQETRRANSLFLENINPTLCWC